MGDSKGAAIFIYGVAVYLAFLAVFLYLIGFTSNLVVPKSISSETADKFSLGNLIIDIVLISIFGITHSVMARENFKTKLTKVIPVKMERSVYNTVAVISLALLYWGWKPLSGEIYDLREEPVGDILIGISLLGYGLIFITTFLINHFELTGLSQSYSAFTGNVLARPKFRQPLFYKYVRHPLYLGFLIAFWVTPFMTITHLVFAIGFTAYILIGTQYEEKSLTADFGSDYADYKNKVPKYFPIKKSGSSKSQ